MTAYATTLSFLDRGIGRADLMADLVAAASAMEFKNNGNIVCIINNGNGSSCTATVKAVADPFGRGGSTVGDQVLTIATTKVGFIPLMHPALFNNGGLTQITLSVTSTVTVGFLELLKAN